MKSETILTRERVDYLLSVRAQFLYNPPTYSEYSMHVEQMVIALVHNTCWVFQLSFNDV